MGRDDGVGDVPTEAEAAAFVARKRVHSTATFGDQSTRGVARHVAKEVEEVAFDPTDGGEWADVALLAVDGAWRAGGTDGEVGARLWAGLWSAPVVELAGKGPLDLVRARSDALALDADGVEGWLALLDAALSGWAASCPGEDGMATLAFRQGRNEARVWAPPASPDEAVEHVRG